MHYWKKIERKIWKILWRNFKNKNCLIISNKKPCFIFILYCELFWYSAFLLDHTPLSVSLHLWCTFGLNNKYPRELFSCISCGRLMGILIEIRVSCRERGISLHQQEQEQFKICYGPRLPWSGPPNNNTLWCSRNTLVNGSVCVIVIWWVRWLFLIFTFFNIESVAFYHQSVFWVSFYQKIIKTVHSDPRDWSNLYW